MAHEMSICKTHGMTLHYKYKRRGKDRLHCMSCKNASQIKRTLRMRQKAFEYKGSKCSACGLTNKNIAIYDYHHLNPLKKDWAIAKIMSHKWETIKEELDKCILVCSNCHREIHNPTE